MDFKAFYISDKRRNGGGHSLRFIKYLRRCQCNSGMVRFFYRLLLHHMTLRYGLEIPQVVK